MLLTMVELLAEASKRELSYSIEPKGSSCVGGFLIPVKRSNVQQSSPGQTEGLKVGCGMGGFKEWVDGWVQGMGGWVGLRNGWKTSSANHCWGGRCGWGCGCGCR
jgi:hypothetical protein